MFTLEQTRAKLKEIVERVGPEYRYNPPDGPGTLCHYLNPANRSHPGERCIAGQVYFELVGKEVRFNGTCDHHPDFMDYFSLEARRYLRVAQLAQDNNKRWEIAYNLAEKSIS